MIRYPNIGTSVPDNARLAVTLRSTRIAAKACTH